MYSGFQSPRILNSTSKHSRIPESGLAKIAYEIEYVFTYSRIVIIFPYAMHHIIVSVKEDEIQMEENKAEEDDHEFVYQPLNHLPWAQLDEKGMTFH